MINNVVLLGRLTATPELKATANGTSVTSFCIAVERRFQPKDGEKVADFINCIAWRGTAEFIARYFKKADMIAVTGEIQTRKYKDKDGNSRTAFEIVVDNASFCGGKSGDNNNNTVNNAVPPAYNVPTAYGAPTAAPAFEDITDEDLPF